MSSFVTLHDDCVEPEELEMIQQSIEMDKYLDRLDMLFETLNKVEDPKCSETAKMIAIERIRQHVGENAIAYLLDAESERKSGITLVAKLTKMIAKLIYELGEMFVRFMAKVISLTAKRERTTAKLITKINKGLHSYVDEKPKIKLTQHMFPIWNGSKIMDGYEFSKLSHSDLGKISADKMTNKLKSLITGIPADLEAGLSLEETRKKILGIEDEVISILKSGYGAKETSSSPRPTLQYGIEGVNLRVSTKQRMGRVPKVKLLVMSTRQAKPKAVDGLTPQEAFAVVTTANQIFNRILDRDDGHEFKKETKDIVKRVNEAEINESVKELVRYIPRWVTFMRDFIKATNEFEYKVGLAAMTVVQASQANWRKTNV